MCSSDLAVKEYHLREQLSESCQNAILVAPQGPVNAPDSSGGKLESKNGLRRLLAELMTTLHHPDVRRKLPQLTSRRAPTLGRTLLSAHSGGFKVTAACLRHGGAAISEVFLFDALYAEGPAYYDWMVAGHAAQEHHKLVSYYTSGSTERENQSLMPRLWAAGVNCVFEKSEGALNAPQFVHADAVFIHTDQTHRGVLYGVNGFRDCLFASCLKRTAKDCKQSWYDPKDKYKPRQLHKR